MALLDTIYMKVAQLMTQLSEDRDTQVGACIVNPQKNVIISSGTNRLPDGCTDKLPMTRGVGLESKYLYVVHAEANAILKRSGDIEGCDLYTTLFPCNECAKLIIQSKIGRVIYLKDRDELIFKASRIMLEEAGISILKLKKTEINNY